MSAARADVVVVVGSGIVGLGAAYASVRRGLSVIVVDRTETPVGSSIRNFGHLCIGAQTGEAREYADLARELWLRLATDAGFWLRESGTLIAARHDDELAVLDAATRDGRGDIRLIDADEVLRRAPLRPEALRGGAVIAPDLQVDPREAVGAIVRHLASAGVGFRFRTSVTAVVPGRIETTRGPIDAGQVVVAVNHDIDQLMPEIAERVGIVRCTLDMMRVAADLPGPLEAPLLTGWSLVRYGRFAALDETAALRRRLHAQRPELAALDLNQMYTQLPDGSLILGDSHAKAVQPGPFQPEAAFESFLDEAVELFDVDRVRVLERWQGVYASGPQEFLRETPADGVIVIAATTGIGMTCGLGLAESAMADALIPTTLTEALS
ncbi:TIGR03364 family FAD-dependent oxidoreductase [Microbacterium esteraromaticum]|uniref:TIGR03364 family FAD-dependent oxidoreductase n=1 Tax=Microbacterium esteraromaticum TaxID=57043 RepID=A0A7D7WDP9_9MICO|nr:TIGR03364 family FAD-dependent oxidoreductase [Microbacterium esteraromaticum]QMU96251.1 TIGR03364 family FAD-dependent oxidoreductase [Microbacterium esteraromaticum]